MIRRILTTAALTAFTGAVLVAAPASAAPAGVEALPGYSCLVAQVSGPVLAAQYCTSVNGAPAAGVISGTYVVSAAVLDGRPGYVLCNPALPPVMLSGFASQSETKSIQVIGVNCVRIA